MKSHHLGWLVFLITLLLVTTGVAIAVFSGGPAKPHIPVPSTTSSRR